MSDTRTEPNSQSVGEDDSLANPKLAYVIPGSQAIRHGDDDISIGELWAMIWGGKWLIIAATVLCAALAVSYALTATEWYRADTLLAPADDEPAPGIGGQFGGLASLAGIDVGGGGDGEPLAVLRSREFAREFIEDQSLITVFFAERWDADAQQWRDPDPESWPDTRDAVRLFRDQILDVGEVDGNGLVSLSIEWTDPDLAATWAALLVERLNARMRQRALAEAESNVAYLQSELANTNLVTIQQSIGRLLETEFQKLMMARGRLEFSYRVIDSAVPPKERSRPRRALIAILGTVLGSVIGFFAALVLGLRRRHGDRQAQESQPG